MGVNIFNELIWDIKVIEEFIKLAKHISKKKVTDKPTIDIDFHWGK